MRGNHKAFVPSEVATGSIPACAGEPPFNFAAGATQKVYPRLCGGTPAGLAGAPDVQGLSPLVRGNRRIDHREHAIRRSIPACAGEPPGRRGSANCSRVYPRLCGGTIHQDDREAWESGLSPLVRGNLLKQCRLVAVPGSIPACAGEPESRRFSGSGVTVYPRLCGGTAGLHLWDGWQRGLSPLVRGNRVLRGSQPDGVGSIPACAGEPRPSRWLGWRRRVYPRLCGGTGNAILRIPMMRGLSPLVRGNRARR